jgi:prepilin-type N-terminal cleavage/methylation domain-containing protein
MKMKNTNNGFTVVEILVVVLIIAIAAMIAVPMMTSAASMQIKSAANMIAADLEYAKSMAISRQKIYTVVFNKSTESYQIADPNGIINHPVKKGFKYIINFKNDSRLDKVDIYDVDFNSTNQVSFDYLGSPIPSNGGVITLKTKTDGTTMTVNVEAVTGFISIQ